MPELAAGNVIGAKRGDEHGIETDHFLGLASPPAFVTRRASGEAARETMTRNLGRYLCLTAFGSSLATGWIPTMTLCAYLSRVRWKSVSGEETFTRVTPTLLASYGSQEG
jgi:hypothetical protein